MNRLTLMTVALGILMLTSASATDQWPQFRGVNAGVVPDDPSLPETWSSTENVAWRADVPGLGWSSPVVWGEQVFVTSALSTGVTAAPFRGLGAGPGTDGYDMKAAHRWMVYAFDFDTGTMRWQRELGQAVPAGSKNLKNSYASATPVTDGERLYVYSPDLGLFALSLDGQVLWAKETPRVPSWFGYGTGSSPTLHENRIYVINGGQDSSSIAAFDTRTGEEIWRTEVASTTPYSTPYVWQHEQRTEIVTTWADKVRSFALDGRPLWELSGMTLVSAPTPFAKHGLLYAGSGWPGEPKRPVYAIRPGASGDISLKDEDTSSAWVAWSQPLLGTYNVSALVYGDYYYTLLDRGLMLCHDAKTGKQIYGRQRVVVDVSGFTASPWAYNGKIFALSEDGDTYVIQAGSEFKVIAKNPLADEVTLATPAIVRGSVIIRTASKLFRIARSDRQYTQEH